MSNYAFYSTILILKMFAVALVTIRRRFSKNVFSSPEDYKFHGHDIRGKDKPMVIDEDVERARKNHLNDLENIPAFLFLGLLFVLTGPNPSTALWHFRVFTISRIFHMFAYQIPLPQPARAGSYIIGLGVCISMAVQILTKASYY